MKKMRRIFTVILGTAMGFACFGCTPSKPKGDGIGIFESAAAITSVTPTVQNTELTYGANDNIRAIYFEGAKHNDKPTSIFAYVGVPKTEKPAAGYPAMVLVHGGLGQAYGDWVKLWTDRGYAAIALSIDANHSLTSGGTDKVNNPQGGSNISITAADMANPKNSWQYISVCNVIYAHNILRAMDNVDSSNIGITGISWGSYLMNTAVGIDGRFKFGIPVYGAGFMAQDPSGGLASVFAFEDDELKIYEEKFDPSVYVANTTVPLMWIAGANDYAFSIVCNQKAADLSKGDRYFSWRANLVHGQQPGDREDEIFAFADYMTKGTEMPLIKNHTQSAGEVSATLTGGSANKAYFYYTQEASEFIHSAQWIRVDVAVDGGTLSASIPDGATYGYMEVTSGDYIVSSKLFSF